MKARPGEKQSVSRGAPEAESVVGGKGRAVSVDIRYQGWSISGGRQPHSLSYCGAERRVSRQLAERVHSDTLPHTTPSPPTTRPEVFVRKAPVGCPFVLVLFAAFHLVPVALRCWCTAYHHPHHPHRQEGVRGCSIVASPPRDAQTTTATRATAFVSAASRPPRPRQCEVVVLTRVCVYVCVSFSLRHELGPLARHRDPIFST